MSNVFDNTSSGCFCLGPILPDIPKLKILQWRESWLLSTCALKPADRLSKPSYDNVSDGTLTLPSYLTHGDLLTAVFVVFCCAGDIIDYEIFCWMLFCLFPRQRSLREHYKFIFLTLAVTHIMRVFKIRFYVVLKKMEFLKTLYYNFSGIISQLCSYVRFSCQYSCLDQLLFTGNVSYCQKI